MVHAIEHPHPDAKRIAGYSIAIAFNALLLMLILVPMQGPEGLRVAIDSPPSIAWYTPPATPKPIVPVSPPTPRPPAAAPRSDTRPVEAQPPVLVEDGTLAPPAIAPAEIAGPVEPSIAPALQPPLPGVRLEYLQAPAPAYPRIAARMRSEGTVLLQVLVDVDGRPLQVEVREGSGDRRLDAAARDQVLRHWRFRPAMQEGRAVQAIGLVPIEFKLR